MRTYEHDEARDLLRPESEGGHLRVIPKPGCVGGKNEVLVSYLISDGSVFVLRRTAKVPYYAVKYFYEVYTAQEVRP